VTVDQSAIAMFPGNVPSSGSSEAGSEEEYRSIDQRCSSPVFDMLLLDAVAVDKSSGIERSDLLEGCMTGLCIRDAPFDLHQSPPRSISSLFRSSTVSNQTSYVDAANDPPPLRIDAWSEAFAHNFMVRGETYLHDSKKIPSQPSLFQLFTVDLVRSDSPNFQGICSHPSERIQSALKLEKESGQRQLPPFIFAVNLCVPASTGGGGTPTKGVKGKSTSCYHLVAYFGIEDVAMITTNCGATALGRLCNKFFFGSSDKFRDQTFKLIPRIADGNYIVRKAVGSKPSILGKKLKQHYVRSDRFMELIVDIGSDSVATRIVKLALGYAKSLTVDMMFLLEGATDDTLPERILGGVRVKNIDFKNKDGQRECIASLLQN
jgi:Protein ENHANCED DISEASE RESISTANCE 2, C-terminal